jgi:ketosteroid isomerase-like protein
MTAQNTRKTLDFGALRGAIERRDPDALLGFYADDAELRVENAALPDSKAFELRGRAQIERYLRAVCDQEMACAVRGEAVFGERSVAFVEACRYGDGSAISVETVLEVAGGRIVRQIDVVARASQDEGSEG